MICCACGEATEVMPCSDCGVSPLLDGRYRLTRVLGRGSNATTYLAEGPSGDPVVVKETPLHWQAPGKVSEMAHREAEVLRQLAHHSIPAYLESLVAGRGKGRSLFLVQEYVAGVDLQAHLSYHRHCEAEVLRVLREICDILIYLHRLSPPVLHRDIKPRNIVRRPDGRLVLVDFGSARDAMQDADLGGSTVSGTFGFMAPEQFRGDADARSDLYGLGATAVALLTRRDPATLLDDRGRIRWHPHARVSPGTRRLIDRLLSPHPADRPQSAEETVALINVALSRPRPRFLPPVVRPLRFVPTVFAAISVALVVAGGALGSVTLGIGGWLWLSTATPSAVAEIAAPPAWRLDLPPFLAPARVDRLFDRGQDQLGRGNTRIALEAFYRIWQVDPTHPEVRRFAARAGERLVLDTLEAATFPPAPPLPRGRPVLQRGGPVPPPMDPPQSLITHR